MKNLFRLKNALLLLVLIFYTCQNDDRFSNQEDLTQFERSLNVKIVDWNYLKTEKPHLLSTIQSLNNEASFSNSRVSSTLYNFYFDESKVQIIDQEGFTTYSFFIYRDGFDVNTVENYVFKEFDDGNYAQFILTYSNPTLLNDGSMDFSTAELEIEIIDDESLLLNRASCVPELLDLDEVQVCYQEPCDGGGNHVPDDSDFDQCACHTNANCDIGFEYCYDLTVFTYEDCSGAIYYETESNESTGQNGGGGNSQNENNDSITTALPLFSIDNLIEDCLNEDIDVNDLNNAPLVFSMSDYSLTEDEKEDIANFLIVENNCDSQTKEFVKLALEADANGGDYNLDDLLIIDPSFKNNQKVNCVYEKLKQIDNSVFNKILESFDNSRVSTLRIRVDNFPSNIANQEAITLPIYDQNAGTNRYFDIVLNPSFIQTASLLEIALVLSHELIHAEIIERSIRLNLITQIVTDISTWKVELNFNNGPLIESTFDSVFFATLLDQYSSYNGGSQNAQWQHELFDVTGYRSRLAQDLSAYHLIFNNTLDPFENYLSNIPVYNISLAEYFDLYTWQGLQGTVDYSNLTPDQLNKLNIIKNTTNQHYNKNCF